MRKILGRIFKALFYNKARELPEVGICVERYR
jgi:hypothetical protein